MSNLDPRNDHLPASHVRQHPRTWLTLILIALSAPLCAVAMAQQAPLTGQMMSDQPQSTPTPAHATPQTPPPATTPAPTASTTQTNPEPASNPHDYARWHSSTRPTRAAPRAQTTAAATPPSPAATSPTAAPMPAYTNLDTSLADHPMPKATARRAAFGSPIGIATQSLLHMQASNAHVSNDLTTLGPEASAAWKRYLASFNYPIPKFMKQAVKSSGGGGGQ